MMAEVGNLILKLHESAINNDKSFKMGESFANNVTTKKIIALLSKKTTGIIKKKQLEALPGAQSLEKVDRFYSFIPIFNQCFNAQSNEIFEGFGQSIISAASKLQISEPDFSRIMRFYLMSKPYQDLNDSLYIAYKNSNRLISAQGLNIRFSGNNEHEIVYLKYFKDYNLFLSKTFYSFRSYDSLEEEIKIKEINILNEKEFIDKNYGAETFEDLVYDMQNFNPLQTVNITQTDTTPEIRLYPEKGKIFITGACLPLSPTTLLDPILEWLNLFGHLGKSSLTVYFKLDYFNTYTTKFLVKFIQHCNALTKKGKEIKIYWYYEIDDEEMKEFGEYLQSQLLKKNSLHILIKDIIN